MHTSYVPLDAILRSVSFMLILFSIDTLLQRKLCKSWLAVLGLALVGIYYIQGMFTGYYSSLLVDIGLIAVNLSLIFAHRRFEEHHLRWLQQLLVRSVQDPDSSITDDDANRLMNNLVNPRKHLKNKHQY